MPNIDAHNTEARLTLRSQLEDLKLVLPWVDALAAKHGIPAKVRYAIDLCLEEVLTNIIRHGYAGVPNQPITVSFSLDGENGLTFIVADNAPHFAPLAPVEPQESPAAIEEVNPGGLGIRLLRRFAGTLAYEQLPDGNRLTIGFPAAK